MTQTRSERIETMLDAWFAAHSTERCRAESIVAGGDPVSLRMLDWFCTNYARNSRVVYVSDNTRGVVDVHAAYKSALATFHKQLFDPFGRTGGEPRGKRPCRNTRTLRLRMRQKNFFRWAVELGVIDYVTAHVGEIEHDMSVHRKKKAKDNATTDMQVEPARQRLATIISNCATSFTMPDVTPLPHQLCTAEPLKLFCSSRT